MSKAIKTGLELIRKRLSTRLSYCAVYDFATRHPIARRLYWLWMYLIFPLFYGPNYLPRDMIAKVSVGYRCYFCGERLYVEAHITKPGRWEDSWNALQARASYMRCGKCQEKMYQAAREHGDTEEAFNEYVIEPIHKMREELLWRKTVRQDENTDKGMVQ